jgi:tryptophan-rich sensory protein
MTDISRKSFLNTAAIAILPVIVAFLLGQLATYPNIAGWYAGLAKPDFNPPNWIFAPVWTTLYILMACAAWRITSLPFGADGRKTALAIFYAQLAMNAVWSWLFFGLHSPIGGLLNIVPQLVLILLTIERFWRLDRVAAICLVPLAGWVGFASILNYAIWQLNG